MSEMFYFLVQDKHSAPVRMIVTHGPAYGKSQSLIDSFVLVR